MHVRKSGIGQKVRPEPVVSTARDPAREVAYALEKVRKLVGVPNVGLDESLDICGGYFTRAMTIVKSNRNKNG